MTDTKLGTAELLFRCAQRMGLNPSWLPACDVFAMTVHGKEQYVSLARSPLNSDASTALAKNKYVTRRILERHNLANIPFTLARTQSEAAAFLDHHETIVAKPITGAGAQDIHIITEPSQLTALQVDQYILEKYIAGKELRFLVLHNKVVGVHRSEYGTSVAQDRPLQRISYPRSDWDPALVALSQRITRILDLGFATVDYLVDDSGQAHVLEVNTMPGLKWFHAPSSGPVVDIAHLFLESIVNKAHSEQHLARSPVMPNSSPIYMELAGLAA